ncbi:MAG: phosphatase [Myxococcaceae bacterium]|nr:phosphatase [Myxococcaceae bacterium]
MKGAGAITAAAGGAREAPCAAAVFYARAMGAGVRLVVFDMAGTTVHDDDLVLECFVAAAGHVGLRVTRDELNARMGQSKRAVFDELARRQAGPGRDAEARALGDRGYEAFCAVLEGAYAKAGVAPIEGAGEVFAWLRSQGTRVALNTGFYRRVTDVIVEGLRWRDAVDAVVCVDDVREGRPAPYMIHEAMQRCGVHGVDEVVVVGDTPSDMLAGRNAGARAVVGVTSGSHTASTLRRCPSTHVLGSVRELPGVIERLGRLTR